MSDSCHQGASFDSDQHYLNGVEERLEILNLDEVFPTDENESNNNDSPHWFRDYESQPEEYSFEDYEPLPGSLKLSGSGYCNGNFNYYYTLPSRNDAVKSQTQPVISTYANYPPSQQDVSLTVGELKESQVFIRDHNLRASNQSTVSEILPRTAQTYRETPRMVGYNRGRHGLNSSATDRESTRKPHIKGPIHSNGAAWRLEDDESDQSSDSMTVTSTVDPMYLRASSQLYYTSPPKLQMENKSVSSDSHRGEKPPSGLSKLTRRLSHKEKKETLTEKRVRQRSSSVDFSSDVERASTEKPCRASIPPSPSSPSRLYAMANGSSPKASPGKLNRSLSGGKLLRPDSVDSKDRRKGERRALYDIQDLFDAVEYQDMEKAKLILDTEDLDINSVNGEDHTPLDVSVMTNHVPMARMLISRGAKENLKYQNNRLSHLNALVIQAERRVNDLTHRVLKGTQGSAQQQKELGHWEFRHRLLKRMKAGYEHARNPDCPTNVRLSVGSDSSLLIRFREPEDHNGAVVTRYKIEWSCYDTFSPLAGEEIIEELRHLEYEIPDLIQGNMYYVRVTAWNIKGYGAPAQSSPPYAIPSSWRELNGVEKRSEGKLPCLDNLFKEVRNSKTAESVETASSPTGSPQQLRKVRKSWKNLFGSTFKFQKSLKRGVYLCSLMYIDDRVLVTGEEHLPIVEVDENFSMATLHSDFHWMMKIASTWGDVKSLQRDMERNSASNNLQFRSKLLQAANQMQDALGVQDLGQLYYKPVKDSNGSIVFVTVSNVKDTKTLNTNSVKWMQSSKLQRKMSSTSSETLCCPELLTKMTSEMIVYNQLGKVKLEKGLYMGYLRLIGTVEVIRVLVPEKTPNVLPHVRMRDCPSISKEEWAWLQCIGATESKGTSGTKAQYEFQSLVVDKSKELLEKLGINEDEAVSSRIYDYEVIELSDDISFLVLVPPVEKVCSMYGYNEEISHKDLLAVPVQVFEMVHMTTYHPDFIYRYARLSSILEMDSQLAQQAQRRAFSSTELTCAKDRVEQLNGFQQTLDEAWKAMRWTMDIITFARDRIGKGGIPLSVLYAPPPSPNISPTSVRREFDTAASDNGYHSDKGSNDSVNAGVSASTQTLPLLIKHKINVQPGVLRVYAAYATGLAKGTSVKLHVTLRTTSREVINLVVQQLNKAIRIKGVDGPTYSEEQLEDFCLVAVIGARERILRDDYQPLQLQNPWTKGRLFVRMKDNLLAALELEHGQSTSV